METLFAGGGSGVRGGGGGAFIRRSSCSHIVSDCLLMASAWSLDLSSAISSATFLAARSSSNSSCGSFFLSLYA